MEESYSFTFKGEKVTIWRIDGAISAKGYDLENELLALKLAGGFGEGVGVILLALAERDPKEPLRSLLEGFAAKLAKVERSSYFPPTSPLLYQYLSYSPRANLRTASTIYGKLSMSAWKRLLNDRDSRVAAYAAQSAPGPVIELNKLAKHRLVSVRKAVAQNPNLSFSTKLLLANDRSSEVRRAVLSASGKNVSPILKKIAQAHSARAEVINAQADYRRLQKDTQRLCQEALTRIKNAQKLAETSKVVARKILQEQRLKEKQNREKELSLN